MIDDVEALMKDFNENVRTPGSIEYPIEVGSIALKGTIPRQQERIGCWVSIRPCEGDSTYLGVYLGDLNVSSQVTYHKAKKEISVFPHTNPAIYVPDLKRVVWGYESWWGVVNKPEELRKITNADIQNVWYVRALVELLEVDTDE